MPRIKNVTIITLKPEVRGKDIGGKAKSYKMTSNVLSRSVIRVDKATGLDSTINKECPASCSHLRQRRKKAKDKIGGYIYGETYCLMANKPSTCSRSIKVSTPLNNTQ